MLFFTRGDASSTVRSRSGFQMLVLRSGFFWLHLWHSGFEVWKKIPHAETWKDGVVKKALDFHGVSNVCINSVYLYNMSAVFGGEQFTRGNGLNDNLGFICMDGKQFLMIFIAREWIDSTTTREFSSRCWFRSQM